MNKREKFKAHLALAITTIIFGINYWVSKGLMPDYLNPPQLVLLRVVGACMLFWGLSLVTRAEKLLKKDFWIIAIAAFFGVTVNQLLFFIGLNLSTPVDVAIIHVSNPIFVLIFAALMIREKITRFKIAGIITGAAGAVVLITYRGNISFSSATFTGNLSALLNTLAYAVYLVMIKPIMARYRPVTVMKWVFLTGLVTSLPFTIKPAFSLSFDTFTPYIWFSLFFVIVVTTFMAYLFTIYALKYIEASVVSYYIYLQPVIATLLSFWLGQQLLSWPHGMAAAMIFLGVYLVSGKIRTNRTAISAKT
ncbi:MAG TPA: DMT family transporter [Bacteroidales bacterium]|nr:DMT family transporter [Bacteroidales bacterium]HPR56895.1 DMT family transporter [Bacteroidales bacterium]HRW96073.1 DMT family transporter [Bacteroidales bacterium]